MPDTPRNDTANTKLAGFNIIVFLACLPVLYAGAFTTTIGAGMVFLDWPLSDGSLNPDGWLEDRAKFAEHSHRLLAGLAMILTIIMAVMTLGNDRTNL